MTTAVQPTATAAFSLVDNTTWMGFEEVARETADALGTSLTAYIAHVSESRAIRQWAGGQRAPRGSADAKLRIALALIRVVEAEDLRPERAKAWFTLPNPHFDGKCPATVLREGDLEKVGPDLIHALVDSLSKRHSSS